MSPSDLSRDSETPLIPFHALRVEELSFQVHLGCSAEERATAQEVRVTIEFRFKEPPRGILSDSLEDTICYAQVSEVLQKHCESGEFQLIERMGYECYVLLKELAGHRAHIGLSIHKVRPPVAALKGGSQYLCGDFLI